MSTKDNLSKAIGAHGMWKSRLRTAIASKHLDIPVSVIKEEGQCEFGKWLLSSEMVKELQTGRGQTVRTLHAEFHNAAARVAELVLSGKQKEAENHMANEGEYGKASSKLTLALMNWRDSI